MNFKIPLFKMHCDRQDIKAVKQVLESGMNWAVGPNVEHFEKALAEYIGAKYSVVFNSGTSALHALMLAFGIGKGDEVIVPAFTFIATANAPVFTGAEPVFAEIEEQTLGLDPNDVEARITKKTKAIMPIHYAGMPCRIKELKKIAQKYNLILIEDTAEALGAKIGKKMAGTFGEAAVLSFCASKLITTGEGGAVVTNSKKVSEKLKLIGSHGRKETENYFSSSASPDYIRLGYNFRLSNIAAALGRSQLKKMEKLIKMRRKNAQYLNKALLRLREVALFRAPKNYFNVYQMYTIRVNSGRKTRDALKDYLNKKGIMAKVYFEPIHLTRFYRVQFGYKKGDLPITEKISEQVLTLPMYPDLTKQEMDCIITELKNFFRGYA